MEELEGKLASTGTFLNVSVFVVSICDSAENDAVTNNTNNSNRCFIYVFCFLKWRAKIRKKSLSYYI